MQKIGHRLIFLEQVKSTNTYLQELPSDQKPHGLIVTTYHQTHGRGQRNHRWEMQADQNIALSLVLSEQLPKTEDHYVLNVITALAVAETAALYADTPAYIKWPNDIILKDKKVAGILIENSVQGETMRESIVGIGLNVNQSTWDNVPTAASLRSVSGSGNIDLVSVQETLIAQLQKYWDFYTSQSINELWSEYNTKLYPGGALSLPSGSTVRPMAVLRDGRLLVQNSDNVELAYKHGDLTWSLDG